MKILYLYTEVMGYTMATIDELVNYGAEIHIVHWDKNRKSPLKFQSTDKVHFYDRSKNSKNKIRELTSEIEPSLVVISGWVDFGYLHVAKELKKKKIPIAVIFDDQWKGTIKQKIASKIPFIFKPFFSHAWVTGVYQFEYARKLGFENDNIIYDAYSADLKLFNKYYKLARKKKIKKYPHRFLFVGRFESVKAIDVLLDAWKKISIQKSDWELHLVGKGSLKRKFENESNVILSDFLQPDELAKEICRSGCFILPSRHEPWGVVIHEFVAAGLPIICSDVCGASTVFLIPGFNGFTFKSENSNSLASKLLKIINSTDNDLNEMGLKSHELGQKITPRTSAFNLLSILK